MKKISFLLIALIIGLTSCKDEKKKETSVEPLAEVKSFIVKPEATSVKWTAYKTTEKKGVGGEFTTLNFNEKSGATVQEALNNLSFSIPISSVFTNDATNTRDAKIKKFFFGAMLDTEFLKGKIKFINGAYVASITMNGVSNDLPLDFSVTDERRVSFKGIMNLNKWNALEALASLNKACFDLHKGADGVSKTWEDVSITIETFLREN